MEKFNLNDRVHHKNHPHDVGIVVGVNCDADGNNVTVKVRYEDTNFATTHSVSNVVKVLNAKTKTDIFNINDRVHNCANEDYVNNDTIATGTIIAIESDELVRVRFDDGFIGSFYISYLKKVNPILTKEWFDKEGKRHNTEGPALVTANAEYWYYHGYPHRIDGPSTSYTDGTKMWHQQGMLHRLDGPAIEYANGNKSWYVEGKNYSEIEFNRLISPNFKCHKINDRVRVYRIHDSVYGYGTVVDTNFNNINVYMDDDTIGIYQPHEVEIVSAVQYPTYLFIDSAKTKIFYKDHAVVRREYASGRIECFENNEFHREDGPAIITETGEKRWYWEGRLVSQTQEGFNLFINRKKPSIPSPDFVELPYGTRVCFNKPIGKSQCIGTIIHCTHPGRVRVVFDDGNVDDYSYSNFKLYLRALSLEEMTKNPLPRNFDIKSDGSFSCFKDSSYERLHNNNGPARIDDKVEQWFENGYIHRLMGPAFVTPDAKTWWYKGEYIASSQEEFDKIIFNAHLKLSSEDLFITKRVILKSEFYHKSGIICSINRNFSPIDGSTYTFEVEFDDGMIEKFKNTNNFYKEYVPSKNTEIELGDKVFDSNKEFVRGLIGTVIKKDASYIVVRYHGRPDIPYKLNECRDLVKVDKNINNSNHGLQVDKIGNIFYKNENSLLHRDDGPAIEYIDGTKCWFLKGKEYTDGTFQYEKSVVNSKNFNVNDTVCWEIGSEQKYGTVIYTDLPTGIIQVRCLSDNSILNFNSSNLYKWSFETLKVNDRVTTITGAGYCDIGTVISKSKLDFKIRFDDGKEAEFTSTKYIHLLDKDKYPPKFTVGANGAVSYKNSKGYFHREDGPAYEEKNIGYKEWALNGKNHRADGPAVEKENGEDRWFYHGKEIKASNLKQFRKMTRQNSFKETFIQDLQSASVRSGTTLGLNAIKTAFRAVLVSENTTESNIKHIMDFFDTSLGEAMLRFSLGHGILHLPIPEIKNNKYAQDISEELRVSGMSKGMDKAFDLLKQFIVPQVMDAYKDTPMFEKKRVASGIPSSNGSSEEEFEEEEQLNKLSL